MSLRVTIHQPYFLPWLGFFARLHACDAYVALDNVEFRKWHFHDRTQILRSSVGCHWLGIPTGRNSGMLMRDVLLPKGPWSRKLKETIRHSYRRAAHFQSESGWLFDALSVGQMNSRLIDLNMCLIRTISDSLGPTFSPPFYMASDLYNGIDRTERIITICKMLRATTLVIGNGGSLRDGLHDFQKISRAGISVEIQDYLRTGTPYHQVGATTNAFVSGLSIVDALFNVGLCDTRELLSAPSLQPTQIFPRRA